MEQSLMGIIVKHNTCTMDKDKLELWDEIRQRGFKDILMFHMLFFHYEEEKHNFNQRHYKITFSPTIRWFGPRSGHPLVEKLTGYTRTSKAPYKCENLVFLRRHTYTLTHTQTPLSVRWAAALEGKFLQTHLYHCSLCSSCVRSLCCLNTMGGQGNHSSCQTDTPSPRQRVEWQQTAQMLTTN